jgi:hypothetical protein
METPMEEKQNPKPTSLPNQETYSYIIISPIGAIRAELYRKPKGFFKPANSVL